MRYLSYVLVGAAALAVTSIAASQTAPRAPTISPQQLQAVGSGDPVLAQLNAKIDSLNAKVDKLSADLAAANKKIELQENARKTVATMGFETAAKLTALDEQFQKHAHYQMYMNEIQEGGKEVTKIYTAVTSIPTFHCKLKPGAPGTGSISTRYDCSTSIDNP